MQSQPDKSFKFISENFLLFDNIQNMDVPSVNDEWIIILQCEQGRFNVELSFVPNGHVALFSENDCRTVNDESRFQRPCHRYLRTPHQRDIPQFGENLEAGILHTPCKVSLPEELIADLNIDWEYLKCRLVECDNEYYMDMMRCLIQSLLYRISHTLDKLIGRIEAPETMQSRDVLTNAFFDLLASTTPKQRSVTRYADKLNKTPKYLSTVVKQTSGRPASEWIQEAVTTEIANYLKNSPKTIKEICNDLDFPSLSFFGRYVREHLGVSPTEYRKQKCSLPEVKE